VHVYYAGRRLTLVEETSGNAELYSIADLDERYGFAIASLKNALKELYMALDTRGYCNIITLSPNRKSDGTLIFADPIRCEKHNAHMIERVIYRSTINRSAGEVTQARDFVYEVMDEFKITNRQYAMKVAGEIIFKAAQVLGIPATLLPVERGHCQEVILAILICAMAWKFILVEMELGL
jgi:hypothetical protein